MRWRKFVMFSLDESGCAPVAVQSTRKCIADEQNLEND